MKYGVHEYKFFLLSIYLYKCKDDLRKAQLNYLNGKMYVVSERRKLKFHNSNTVVHKYHFPLKMCQK